MPRSVLNANGVESHNLASASHPPFEGKPDKNGLFLVTDAGEYYQEVLNLYLFGDELVWLTPGKLMDKTASEMSDLLRPASAVLIDWCIPSAALLNALLSHGLDREVPLLALCGEQEAEHVSALILGADGTMNRRFNPIMLNAKLVAFRRSINARKAGVDRSAIKQQAEIKEAVLSATGNHGFQKKFTIGSLTVDKGARVFYVYNKPLRLTSIEFDLLCNFMENQGTCLKRDAIINKVWGINYETGTNFLDVHVHALRKKMRNAGLAPHIYTVRGVGYRFEAIV